MDKYIKFILTMIAVVLLGILFKDEIISTAHAKWLVQERQTIISNVSQIAYELGDIASAIRSCK